MPTSFLGPYTKTILSVTLIALTLAFAFTGMRVDVWNNLLPFFEWMETTPLGYVGKTWGAVWAAVEAVHLLALAVLGGCIIVSDGKLLGLWFTDVPARTVVDTTHKVFVRVLIILLLTGVFMASAVAMKLYYMPVYWYKMLALVGGMLYVFFIRKPLLAGDIDAINPWIVKMVAISSLLIWFTVAATGRWIGFS